MLNKTILGLTVACCLTPLSLGAQTPAHIAVLRGLAPVTVLANTPAGRTALSANYTVTGGIQTGAIRRPTLLPFAEQQQLRDAFITDGNLTQLADGLGTKLGAAYLARAHYTDRESFTSVSPAVAGLVAYTNATTGSDSNAGKYFFVNATVDGKTAVSSEAANILKHIGGSPDPFGTSYGRPAGSPGADAYGDSRPFPTEPHLLPLVGPDCFDVPADYAVYNRGPIMNLVDSPSYPSGHTTYGYMGALVLAEMVPERFPELMARAAEYGDDRIIMGAQYAMDVLAGRTLATYDLAHLLANDPAYLGRTLRHAPTVADDQAAIRAARADVRAALEVGCGNTVAVCAHEDIGRPSNPAIVEAFHAVTQTYDLPIVHPKVAAALEDVGQRAPEPVCGSRQAALVASGR